LVDQVAGQLKLQVSQLIGNEQIKKIRVSQLQSESFGAQTVQDLLAELQKPGRDPRPEFRMAKLTDGVESIKDLILGALMEGTISNVTNFGAFVDLGVHQDGLVHISALSKQFVKDPHSVVKAGDIVKVKIMQIDVARKRIGLSMRLDDELPTQYDQPTPARPSKKEQPKPVAKVAMGSMAQKLKEAQIRAKGRG